MSKQESDNIAWCDAAITSPKIVGGYRVTPNEEYGLVFMTFTKKPSWWHRMWCRLLLGWHWVDEAT